VIESRLGWDFPHFSRPPSLLYYIWVKLEFCKVWIFITSASCTIGTGTFPGVKSGRGVTLTPSSAVVMKD
jgi:hypothetical protein